MSFNDWVRLIELFISLLQVLVWPTPYIIYAGSRRPEHVAKAKAMGAFGTTNDPQELLELVIQAVKR